jgi:general secretion pathway protein G
MFRKNTVLANDKGMTLLEIMIVLAILAGLIAVLAGKVTGSLKKARMNETRIQIGEYGKALDQFYTDCGFYPSGEGGLKQLIEAPSNCSNWGPEAYLKKLSPDPWHHDYIYESSGNDYVLKSLGSDGKEGGTGDAADISSKD